MPNPIFMPMPNPIFMPMPNPFLISLEIWNNSAKGCLPGQ